MTDGNTTESILDGLFFVLYFVSSFEMQPKTADGNITL